MPPAVALDVSAVALEASCGTNVVISALSEPSLTPTTVCGVNASSINLLIAILTPLPGLVVLTQTSPLLGPVGTL